MPKRECIECRALFDIGYGHSRCGVCRQGLRQARDAGRRSPAYRALAYALKHNVIPCAIDGCDNRATQVDHIIPFIEGGTETYTNLRPLCTHHNASKGKK